MFKDPQKFALSMFLQNSATYFAVSHEGIGGICGKKIKCLCSASAFLAIKKVPYSIVEM